MSEEKLEQTEIQQEEVHYAQVPESNAGLDFFEKNKKVITGIVVILLLAIGGSFIYNNWIVAPKNKKSIDALWHSEYSLLNEENWTAAINGDSLGNKGLKKVAEEFSGYTGGKIAQYDLGIAYLNNGQYSEAIEALKKVDFDDEMISTIALGAIGDAYIAMENASVTDAAEYYEKAYKNSNNELTAPIYMLKAAYARELEGKYEAAVKIYEELISKFPNVSEAEQAKKYLELAKVGKSVHQL